ncbi:RNA polymerase III RPC4-domain-containing protein [Hypoxylon sp. FL0543]|nr:RNA polymerase III RPC4-domain-containing protein [Hypoxylon sp. FL0543]
MPPRGSRGAGARGRGRGRGAARAGRSGAASRAPADDAETQPLEAPSLTQNSPDGSDVAIQDGPTLADPIESSSTPDTQADQPTATSSRSSQTPSAGPSRAGGRFRPKNVRRDAAERARLEAERNRDLAVKLKEEERELRAEERRARRGRGRGRGDTSRGGFIRRTVTATGPFSAIPPENVKDRGPGWGRGVGGASSVPEYNTSRYKPRRDYEDRLNIDLLNGFTGSLDDGKPSRYNQRSSGTLPVGLLRTEHEEEEVKVKTTAELEAEEQQASDDEDLFVSGAIKDLRDLEMGEDSEIWHAAPKSQVKVKTEPGTEPEAMDIDMADIPEAVQTKAPPSPELRKKLVVNEDSAAIAQKKRREKAAKDPEILQTVQDLQYQLDTLSFKPPAENEKGGEAEAEAEAEEEHGLQPKDDQMFLFQLPPILPPLAKATDDANGEAGAAGLMSQENKSGATATKVKTEDGVKKEDELNPFATLPPEGGLIGKINVRKSGKVEFDWGGTILSLGVGAETEFLTTAVMVEQNIDLQNPEASTGFAYGMGEIMNRFVLAPIWDEEEDWDPSLDGIDGLEQ